MLKFTAPSFEECFQLSDYGLVVTGQALRKRSSRTELVLECRISDRQQWCGRCGGQGKARGSRTRWLIHSPIGTRPVHLMVWLRCFTCTQCQRYWSETIPGIEPRVKLTPIAILWALTAVVVDSTSIYRVALNLGAAWNTVHSAVLGAGYDYLINDPERLAGVKVIGVDEHCWRHTRVGSRYVTVIIDLTPRRSRQSARLLDIVPGRSKDVLKAWIVKQTPQFQQGVKTVAMDGFTGYKTAVQEALPQASTVMDPFHVVQLAGDKLTKCRQRLQQETHGRRGRTQDELYQVRRSMLTRAVYVSPRAWDKVIAVISNPKFSALKRLWDVYQAMILAYADPNKKAARNRMAAIIDALTTETTRGHPELRTLARTLKNRRTDILAHFTHPGASNGPTEAINGRLEHLRGIALGFTNISNYITRSLLHAGGFKTQLQRLL